MELDQAAVEYGQAQLSSLGYRDRVYFWRAARTDGDAAHIAVAELSRWGRRTQNLLERLRPSSHAAYQQIPDFKLTPHTQRCNMILAMELVESVETNGTEISVASEGTFWQGSKENAKKR